MAGALVEIKQVAYDALPILSFEFEGVKLSTSFADIKLDVRLESGEKLFSAPRDAIVDDDENGVFHFEFLQDEVPPGVHEAEVIFYDLNTPTNSFRLPEVPLRVYMRERV